MTREEAIKELEWDEHIEINPKKKEAFQMAIEALKQEPKTGHWIEERTYMECPNCHDIWHYEENQTERFKFCPTCGGEN